MSYKTGGYTDFRVLTEDDLNIFNIVMSNFVGVEYRPATVSTTVANGTSYRYFCDATPVALNPIDYSAFVYISKSSDGNVKLVKITKLIEV